MTFLHCLSVTSLLFIFSELTTPTEPPVPTVYQDIQGKLLQGEPNQNFRFQVAITLKLSTSDPMLVSQNVFEHGRFFEKL